MWRRNFRVSGYVALCALISVAVALRFTRFSLAVSIASIVCGFVAFSLSVVQAQTKRQIGFFCTLFSITSMLFITHHFASREQQTISLWHFGSIYLAVWFGLVFVFRRYLLHKLEVTNAA